MQPVLLERTRRDWLGIIGEAGVPVAPVNNIAELAETEQLQAMDMMRTLPGSDLRVVGLPVSFDGQRPLEVSAPPVLGSNDSRYQSTSSAPVTISAMATTAPTSTRIRSRPILSKISRSVARAVSPR